MEYFEQTHTVLSSDVDGRRKVPISGILRLFQELTIAFTESAGVTRRETLDRGLLWVISRQELSMRQLPAYGEKLTLRCKAAKTLDVFFPRHYRLTGDCGAEVSGSALWLLIDEATRKPVYPRDRGIQLQESSGTRGLMLPRPVSMPKRESDRKAREDRMRTCRVTVPRHLADINGHMGNAGYFDLVEEFLTEDEYRDMPFGGVRVEYLQEVAPGTPLDVVCIRDGGDVYFEGDLARGEEDPIAFRIAYLRESCEAS
ncbi:acyl-[acyl-carrier-protein] thioesterase [Curtanaerobium respiraculi]|uniref:acyl-[acyl-carrier-protein] thioesterase n=1 Tax=Curtanaerobium respiraculi TaxID=2949669 RepID=UPI0024B367D7|nr:acyl-ACP thioesterase domain-containing protein [Curtanaerobium respiraculi]